MPTIQELTAELDRRDTAIAAKMAAFDGLKAQNDALTERIEELEAKAKQPGGISRRDNDEAREHRARFEAWLRRPRDSETKNALGEMESRIRQKSLSIGVPSDGGYAVPEEISREIGRLERKLSPIRDLVRVDRTASNDNKMLVDIGGTSSGWVGETDARNETDTPELRERASSMGEIYAYPQTTEWMLDDAFFNVGDWLAESVATEFAIKEGDAVIRGDGDKKPIGMLATTPSSAADFASPPRAAAAYQFLPSLSGSSPAVAEIMPDALIDLVYGVNARYRASGAFAMNSLTAGRVRKLKNLEGNYLWQPALVAGQPEQLLGFPVHIIEAMDDVATNAFPIGFGDFRRAYRLVDRTEIRITIDANITTPGRIKYFVRRREGGCVLDNHAIKFLRTTVA